MTPELLLKFSLAIGRLQIGQERLHSGHCGEVPVRLSQDGMIRLGFLRCIEQGFELSTSHQAPPQEGQTSMSTPSCNSIMVCEQALHCIGSGRFPRSTLHRSTYIWQPLLALRPHFEQIMILPCFGGVYTDDTILQFCLGMNWKRLL